MSKYTELLFDLPLDFLEITPHSYSSFHLAIIKLHNLDNNFHKKVFISLKAAKIGVQIHYIPVHLQPFYRAIGFKDGDFPESELYAKNAISLPLYYGLEEQDQIKVAESLKLILKS